MKQVPLFSLPSYTRLNSYYLFRKLNLDVREQKLVDRMMESALKRLIREPIVKLKQVKDKGKRDEYIKLIEELFEV